MKSTKTLILFCSGMLFVAGFAVQIRSVGKLQKSVAELREEFSLRPPAGRLDAAPERVTAARAPGRTEDAQWHRRVAELEQAVAELTRASDYLMERGQLPLASIKLESLQRTLVDPNAPDRDRLQALRLLRRNRGLSDDLVQYAVGWLQGATNGGVREDVLQQLEGLTNAVLQMPLVALAMGDSDADVREQAVENLRRFVADPQVEAQLWQLMRSDPDEDVREQAQEALVEGPMTETRLAGLRTHAADPQVPVQERLTALEALREADVDAPEVVAALLNQAQITQDPIERERLFNAFDGMNDPTLAAPLVLGLQDPHPAVRERAADALSGFRDDPAVHQWLLYTAENDADPQVRREALRALRQGR